MIYTLSELSYKCDECNSPLPFTMLWIGLTVNYILIFFSEMKVSLFYNPLNWRTFISRFGTSLEAGMDWMDSTVIVTKMWVPQIIAKCLLSEF